MVPLRLVSFSKKIAQKYSSRDLITRYCQRCASTSAALPRLSYMHNKGEEPLVYRTVGQQLERAAINYGSSEAIVSCHEGQRITYAGLLEEADRLAVGLLKLGLKPGDFVALWGTNNLHWELALMSAARAGLITVGINPAFQAPELEYCLKKVNVKAIIAPENFKKQNFYDILCSVCPEILTSEPESEIKSSKVPTLRHVIINTPNKLRGAHRLDDIRQKASKSETADIAKIQPFIMPDSPCNVQFTSGTTGKPKAPVLSHYNLVNNGIVIGHRNRLEGQRICMQVPYFHAFGLAVTIMSSLSKGATIVLPAEGYSPKDSLHAIVNEKCTVIHGTPTMYVDLINTQKELQLPLTTPKLAVSGGAPCSPQLFEAISEVLGPKQLHSVFGMTESTAITFQTRYGDTKEQMLNTVGYICDHFEAKVVDAEGNMVPFGQPGELYVRGYGVMLGYYEDEEKTRETIGVDRWLRTGDQFVLQEDGYGRIVGRLKEMIIRGGENIFPKEIEDFLNKHPHIAETHVVGVPDERMGEEICAFVRLQDGCTKITRDELKEFCQGKLAHFKVPRYVFALESFPKTTSGKIQKFQLQALFKDLNKDTRLSAVAST